MTKFDVANGTIHVGNNLALHVNQTPQELFNLGLSFDRTLDMKTGWFFRITTGINFVGHVIPLSLGFQNNLLKRFSFAFADNLALNDEGLFQEHCVFLQRELGNPTYQRSHQIQYLYSWGQVVAEIDPRGGGSYVSVIWE